MPSRQPTITQLSRCGLKGQQTQDRSDRDRVSFMLPLPFGGIDANGACGRGRDSPIARIVDIEELSTVATEYGGKIFYRTVSEKPQCCRPRRYAEAMKDANDGKPWTEIDVRGLMAALRVGDTIEEAAEHLCRSGTIKDVRYKAEELGLKYKSRG
jgi:hypothetical protein